MKLFYKLISPIILLLAAISLVTIASYFLITESFSATSIILIYLIVSYIGITIATLMYIRDIIYTHMNIINGVTIKLLFDKKLTYMDAVMVCLIPFVNIKLLVTILINLIHRKRPDKDE